MTLESGSRVLEGVGDLDFRERGSSVIGALTLALETIGDPIPYEELMGASGAAFRVQMAQPAWCASAPYAALGFDVIPYAAAALGRSIEWIQPDPGAADPMARRTRAVIESIDRAVPVLYGAEECGLIVGYHQGGRHFSLRTYFDESEPYTRLRQWSWPAPGLIGERAERPDRRANLRRALELASRITTSETHYPMRDERHYVVGFDALECWVRDLRHDTQYVPLGAEPESGLVLANRWCYTSLIDARRAAASYLASFDAELSGEAASALSRAAARYGEVVKRLVEGLPHVPEARATLEPDPWSAERRHGQADTLDAVLELERDAIADLERCLPLIETTD